MKPQDITTIGFTVTSASDPISVDVTDNIFLTRQPIETNITSSEPADAILYSSSSKPKNCVKICTLYYFCITC